jgi:hypothetical protein
VYHGEHVGEQYITGQPRVLPALERIVFREEPTRTDQLLRFLAGTHMPSLKEVWHTPGTIRPSSSSPWWKTALIRAATGALRKCSYVDLNLFRMSDTAEEAAAAFLSNWRVEDSLIDKWQLDLGSMVSCTRTALSHLVAHLSPSTNETMAPRRRTKGLGVNLTDVLAVGIVAEAVVLHLDTSARTSLRLSCKSAKAEVMCLQRSFRDLEDLFVSLLQPLLRS